MCERTIPSSRTFGSKSHNPEPWRTESQFWAAPRWWRGSPRGSRPRPRSPSSRPSSPSSWRGRCVSWCCRSCCSLSLDVLDGWAIGLLRVKSRVDFSWLFSLVFTIKMWLSHLLYSPVSALCWKWKSCFHLQMFTCYTVCKKLII